MVNIAHTVKTDGIVSIADEDTGTSLNVNSDGSISIATTPTIYADTATPLNASTAFTGTTRDAGATNTMRKFCAVFYADKDGTAKVQNSVDGTTWYDILVAPLTAFVPVAVDVDVNARYHRVYYTNGAVTQTSFMIRSSYQRV